MDESKIKLFEDKRIREVLYYDRATPQTRCRTKTTRTDTMTREEEALASQKAVALVDEAVLVDRVSETIENRKYRAGAYANREVTLVNREIGQFVGSVLLDNRHPEYGKRILATLSQVMIEATERLER